MVVYAKNELIGISELGKSLGVYIDKVTNNVVEKLTIIRRNKPEAVIIPIEEYENMKEMMNYIEDMEISSIIQERMKNKHETIDEDEMLQFLKDNGKNV